ncbi:pyridoxal phosphate-dependent decarboxylase family protein [Henriciella marina]|uniref:pyridoxal phosphate-dependent decarboxylase family protein n=1 Tax=Henriciella marina TaxID=453851 RepID=UPI0003A87855|nr:pyridoxal-dependent decarboxylase [Henriciella marina]
MTDESDAKGLLDPEDWTAFRARAHETLDRALEKLERAGTGRVWTPVPESVDAQIKTALTGAPLSSANVDDALASLLPHGVGNTHPRFLGWVHGTGTPFGLLPAMMDAAMNANCGGRDHVGLRVERELTSWVSELFGFPDTASGLVVTGTSMATIIAMKVARDAALNFQSRENGIDGAGLVGYTSSEAHACNARAFDMLGLGAAALRKVPVDDAFRLNVDALKRAIEADREAGLTPFAIIGTAGTVNTGAIDDLDAIGEIAEDQSLWLHVDGAFAASGVMSPDVSPKLRGIERASSIAFDFHKWLHVNYDAGFVLVRDEALHRQAFSSRPDYLKAAERGLAAGNPWPVEYGPELSRGFRALKIWAHIAEFGTKRLGEAISHNCRLIERLASLVDDTDEFERLAPISTSICCFRYVAAGLENAQLDALNEEIVIRLQEIGIAAPSTTGIGGRLAIRVNMTNHRTREQDLHILLDAIRELAPAAIEAVSHP